MSYTTALFAVLAVGAVTYTMRAGLILALADTALLAPMLRALRYVAPAVLAALTVSLLANPEAANRGITLAEIAGIGIALPVAWKTKNLIATLAAGMIVFWVVLSLG